MKILLGTVFLFTTVVTNAQLKGFSIGPYAEMAWPAGDFEKTHKTGLGAGLGADIRFGKIGFTGSAGYLQFPGTTTNTTEGSIKNQALAAFPLRAGIKFRPLPFIYFKLESGAANLTKNRGSVFILAPGMGVRLLGLDIMAKYETWKKEESFSFWAVKLGYNF